jgi:hypothetical protein
MAKPMDVKNHTHPAFQEVWSKSEIILKAVSDSRSEESLHRSHWEFGRRRRIFARIAIHQGKDGWPEAAYSWQEPLIFFGLVWKKEAKSTFPGVRRLAVSTQLNSNRTFVWGFISITCLHINVFLFIKCQIFERSCQTICNHNVFENSSTLLSMSCQILIIPSLPNL